MGIHESQSRFFENLLGKNRNFWITLFPKLKEKFKEELLDVDFNTFFESINLVKPSLIRIEADELTYSLHIMLRYEIEKDLIKGNIEVKDLPKIWNKLTKEFFNLSPQNDAEGVLQDIHWAGGSFGYFPSYALGNAYASQFYNTMNKKINIDDLLKKGDFKPILNWLKENIHKYGKLKDPSDILFLSTEEELNPIYYINYLENKYNKLYNL